MERLHLEIDGMSCEHCVRAVKDALQQVPGTAVEEVEIGRATVAYDPARATPEQLMDAVADEGYAAHRAG
jgi:copper chaperone